MGEGKTAVWEGMKLRLNNAVFLDGNWCRDAVPLLVIEERKAMALRIICFILNSFDPLLCL